MKRKYNIVCFSGQYYKSRGDTWTNKQHMMSRLSGDHRVIYVNPPSFFGVERFPLRAFPFPLLEKESDNLCVFRSIRTRRGFMRTRKLDRMVNKLLLKRYIEKLSMRENLVLWFYTPDPLYFIGELGESFVLYDCVDIFSAMPAYSEPSKRSEFIERERRLVKAADLVTATSEAIYRDKKKLNERTFLVPNVGDFRHFSAAGDDRLEVAKEIADLKKPVIGFTGVITDFKLDIRLLEEVAGSRPGWSIVLIGPLTKPFEGFNSSSLRRAENVRILGKVPYERLPSYVKGFDVCIIPYKINDYTVGVLPIKFFEHLATGKPVVATPLPSLRSYRGLVRLAESAGDFIRAVEEALEERDESLVARRIEIAGNNTWERRIQKITDLIEEHWPETIPVYSSGTKRIF